jgi:hypothetical protein
MSVLWLISIFSLPGETKMFARLIAAYRHFICLRSGEFESRQFPVGEAIIEVYYELFA